MKKVLLAALILSPLVFGGVTAENKYKLNEYMGKTASEARLGDAVAQGGGSGTVVDGIQVHQTMVSTYDFAVHGGASVAPIGLGSSLPQGAIITRSWIDVITAIAGTGACINIGTNTASNAYNDIKAATAVTGFGVGQVEGVSTGTAANMKKMATDRQVAVAIYGAALTAGKFKVYTEYSMSQ